MPSEFHLSFAGIGSCNALYRLTQYTNHVTFGSENTLLETLNGHPLDRKSASAAVAAVVVTLVNVARQTKVGNFDGHAVVQPTKQSHPLSLSPAITTHQQGQGLYNCYSCPSFLASDLPLLSPFPPLPSIPCHEEGPL